MTVACPLLRCDNLQCLLTLLTISGGRLSQIRSHFAPPFHPRLACAGLHCCCRSLCLASHAPALPSSYFFQGHLREGKCHLSLGNAMAACRSFQRALELDHKNAQAQQEVRSGLGSVWSSRVLCGRDKIEVRTKLSPALTIRHSWGASGRSGVLLSHSFLLWQLSFSMRCFRKPEN